ncbi:cytochrome P450 [Actinomadura sp. ATCC 31491]|uniref:Cytochrome P450 n=1 Tax=Actinomadura luzonensis TaxID=2805427 RepID=A0ABT0FVZ7_9ACTN|nr:cytochrome P450 [Actinomadura luzonensis]MCK2216106.1 cytochrome P450 [Actinomadura luzonensis]
MPLDNTPLMLLEGYGWLPARRRESPDGVARTRVLGRRATGLCGPEAARFFYDEDHVHRHGAIPGLVQSTLFGHGPVHTLDGADHRVRKAMFLSLMTPGGVADLARRTAAAWDEAAAEWAGRPRVVLFDEAARVLARAVTDWAGVQLPRDEADELAADCVAMVDGFATLGARHWRARRARARQEARLARLVEDVRRGAFHPAEGSALAAVARHRDAHGERLDPRVAAVELLNVIRPTVAVCWFVAYAGHALHRWPEHRERLRAGDEAFAEAFAHELRRFYPFAPFVGGRAARDLTYGGYQIPAGTLVLLDLYGQNHDPELWPDPYAFRPERFLGRAIDPYELVPQGGGEARTGHRCPGEDVTVAVLRELVIRLARLEHDLPPQDLGISLRRVPARPASGIVLADVRAPAEAAASAAPRP